MSYRTFFIKRDEADEALATALDTISAADAETALRQALNGDEARHGADHVNTAISLNNLAGLAWTTGEIALVSDGSPWRPLVHVEDIGEAIVQVLQGPREAIAGETFNVGDDGQNFQVREIAAVVSEVFPGCRLTVGPSQGDDRSYRVRFDKIRRHLPEFRCRRTLLSGARELHDLFGRIELTTEQFTSRHHTRLLQLQHLLASNQIDSDLNWTTGVSA